MYSETTSISTDCIKPKPKKKEEIKTINNLIKTIPKWVESFKFNNNTGVFEEIKSGIEILLSSGLDNYNNLPDEYKDLLSQHHHLPNTNAISGLINLTQSDNIGGTGDIGIVYDDGNIEYFSVTQWSGKPVKCICNPSASSWYNLHKTLEIEKMNDKAYNLAKKHREENYGDTPNKKWKRLNDCPGAKMMAEYLAKMGSTSWNTMDNVDKIKSLHKFLDLDAKLRPHADGIIYWNNKKKCIEHIYKWELNINIEDYLDTYSDGIYIYHGKPDNYILKTQAKYNNGIIEGMSTKVNPDQWVIKKSTSYLSSWDVVAPDLTKIFKMTTITLDK
jgi:hypothetical protein